MSAPLELLAALLTVTVYVVGLYAFISHRSRRSAGVHSAGVHSAGVHSARVQTEERR